VEAGDEVDAVGEDQGHCEGPAGCGEDVGDLNVELAPVVVDPAAGEDAGVDAVEADNVGGAEESVCQQAEHAGHTVLREHVHGIIDLHPVLDLGGVIADDASDDTEDHGSPSCAESGRGRGGNET